ncbi:class A beta-lactamase [Nocardia puris]|uniref:Beta-lactamase n=1 Tax=Nocardia puris TaxID=208602 RepID=A0A366DJ93_9NOCA|nr:class A beta-lactamase [Nocardia puris]MBF6213390.1 class A beta-lactamase [Nocardia puris]MBF6369441.1 class A beta-lactamase [Nocardia puris]MBF6462270.1 class A beta-lactamase [Nocardia puris]RBO89579.1 beta-lactamase class A [Nocardia puris]
MKISVRHHVPADRRRAFAAALLVSALAWTAACGSDSGVTATSGTTAATTSAVAAPEFADLEARHDARLGVFAVDTGSGRSVAHRADERFPMASTFKGLACGTLLVRHPLATGYFDQVVRFSADELVEYSPVTETRVDTGMTVAELCHAAITVSDNTAGNQLLKLLGGPEGFTASLRALGDDTSRLDRWETELNTAIPGDERDTTTPAALVAGYRALVVDDALAEPERAQLTAWLVANTTGDTRIRAGVPDDWKVGDKTGTPAYGSALDVAVAWPPGRAPIVIAVLSTKSEQDAEADSALLAEATRAAVHALG